MFVEHAAETASSIGRGNADKVDVADIRLRLRLKAKQECLHFARQSHGDTG